MSARTQEVDHEEAVRAASSRGSHGDAVRKVLDGLEHAGGRLLGQVPRVGDGVAEAVDGSDATAAAAATALSMAAAEVQSEEGENQEESCGRGSHGGNLLANGSGRRSNRE